MIPVGTEVRRGDRVGVIVETGMNNGSADYSKVRWNGENPEYPESYYDSSLEIINSTRSITMQKLNVNGPAKEFLVKATYANPLQGIRETREFDSESQAKDFAARSVVDANKGAEAYIYRLERVARLPLPDVDWASNKKGE
jgi:hypothetical protein